MREQGDLDPPGYGEVREQGEHDAPGDRERERERERWENITMFPIVGGIYLLIPRPVCYNSISDTILIFLYTACLRESGYFDIEFW